MHLYRISDPANLAEKARREASNWVSFDSRTTLFGEGAEAKKRMFNLANRHPIENKETLDEQTGDWP